MKAVKLKKMLLKKMKRGRLKKVLNFGHTFAHTTGFFRIFEKIKSWWSSNFGYNSALKFSLKEKLINYKDYQSVMRHMKRLELPFNLKKYFSKTNVNKILSFMIKDKKNNSKKINLVLIRKIGLSNINQQYNNKKVKNFLKYELLN